MVAEKASVRSFDFVENCFSNYSLNIPDSGKVVRDILWKNKIEHGESDHITRRHFLLLDLILSFLSSLKFKYCLSEEQTPYYNTSAQCLTKVCYCWYYDNKVSPS